ncbi:MAG: carbohydrate ABC transporter, N-acetylglucosamine/diacetylchitobiose-binding protein [Micromonosporaceae bacterium]|nr:carbohydrate ABC transporter, N-acetylglucosamine/diacetylchitobiose-binding protein [Micromonosporaceae bacterium]
MSRRGLLQRAAIAGLVVSPAGGLLAGCATAGGENEEAERGKKSAKNPLGVKEDAPLEVVIFNGGFTDKYATDIHEPLYEKAFPKAKIKHSKTEEIAKALQSRFVSGSPPDVVNNSGANQMDPGKLVSEGQLLDLTELFDAPSVDDPKVKVRDTLIPGTIESGAFDGKPYQLNYAFTVFGIWYSQSLFDKHSWEYPQTWDDMVALCKEIKKAGIAPWTYQGKHPRYMNWPLLSMATKQAGPDILVKLDNLEPGAWEQEAILEAATRLYELKKQGFILKGTEGMDHVQAQTAWTEGKAAFVPCGSWLENEQKDTTPEGFEMTVAPEPLLSNDSALPYEGIRATAGEPFLVPTKAKNAAGGLEYLRRMLSKEGASGFSEMVSSLTAVQGAADGLELSPGLSSAAGVLKAAGENVFNWMYPTWYKTMENPAIDAATGDLLANRIKPAEWVKRCEKAAKDIRDDDSVTKFKR